MLYYPFISGLITIWLLGVIFPNYFCTLQAKFYLKYYIYKYDEANTYKFRFEMLNELMKPAMEPSRYHTTILPVSGALSLNSARS